MNSVGARRFMVWGIFAAALAVALVYAFRPQPVPVDLTYLTAWVNKDGSVHFRDDIYGRDERLKKALQSSRRAL